MTSARSADLRIIMKSWLRGFSQKNEYAIYSDFTSEKRKIEFLAGRFSAKEAVVKALDVPKLVKDIEILNDENGKPYCTLEGYKIHISISHETEYSCAYALCESLD